MRTLSRLGLLSAALLFSGHALACNVPNPNLTAPPYVDGCPVPAAALNALYNGNTNFSGNPAWNLTYSAIGSSPYAQALAINVTDTGENITGFAKVNGLTLIDEFGGGATGPGNRAGIWATLQQIGPTLYNVDDIFQSAVVGYTQVLTGNAAGQYLDYNGGTFLTSLETSGVNAVYGVGMEADINGITGTSFVSRIGVNAVSGGLGQLTPGVRGTAFDSAFAVGQTSANSATWKTGYSFGQDSGVWPGAADTIIFGTFGSGTLNAAYGISMTNVTFGTAAIATPGFEVTATGGVESVGADNALLGFFAGATSAIRLENMGTSAFLAATNAANNALENLTLQGTTVSLAYGTIGSTTIALEVTSAGAINVSGATLTGSESACLALSSNGNIMSKTAGTC